MGAALAAAGIATVLRSPDDPSVPVAAAQPDACLTVRPFDSDIREAMAHEDYARAVELLRRAIQLAPRRGYFLVLGRACSKLADHACALEAFTAFLAADATPPPAAEQVEEAEAGVRAAEALVGSLVLEVATAPLTIVLDDVSLGVARALAAPVRLNPGPHECLVTWADGEERRRFELASGETLTLSFEARPAAVPLPCLSPPPPPPQRGGCGCGEIGR